ncbi:MAG TPA: glycosyltransferase [Polyangia bacterium]
MIHLSQLLFVGCAFGLTLYALQLFAVAVHRRAPAHVPQLRRGISILKPLCGLDDDLVANLECFVALDYAPYELLLGVRDRDDAAYPVAVAFARRFPRRVRVVLQRGTPGLNPKVNQLATLARAARYEIVVVSDSNVRVAPGYLDEIAAYMEDPKVGLVTHPIAGIGEVRFGSLMDNLHLCASVGAGMIGVKRIVGKDIVVGKSMALRKADLAALGGFEAFADVLAEDYLLGKDIALKLKKRVVVGKAPVRNVSERRDARDFYRRYRRWSVMHRQCIGGPVYAAQALLNPTMVAAAGWLVHPSLLTLGGVGVAATLKLVYDGAALAMLRGGRPPVAVLVASPAKDALLACAWAVGLWRREIDWRGNPLRVLPGTRLVPVRDFANSSHAADASTLKSAA